MIPAVIFGFLKNSVPWKDILRFLIIGGVIFAVFLYVKKAEENRNKAVTLEVKNAELVSANETLEAEYKKQIRVLQNAVLQEREREKEYAENIKIIREGPDGECARHSPAILNSLRMRREREARDASR